MCDSVSDSPEPAGDATVLLGRIRAGDREAEGRLYELLQDELRRLARVQLNGHADRHTLQPTALVHEAWLRLSRSEGARPADRGHFIAVAARAMRSALVDHARRRTAAKRGGGLERRPLDDALEQTLALCVESGFEPLELDDALERLARDEPRQARVVELRFFGGLTTAEAADVLGVSRATVVRDWELARHWLLWELGLAED